MRGVTVFDILLSRGFIEGGSAVTGFAATVVERRSVTGELSLSCARHAADG